MTTSPTRTTSASIGRTRIRSPSRTRGDMLPPRALNRTDLPASSRSRLSSANAAPLQAMPALRLVGSPAAGPLISPCLTISSLPACFISGLPRGVDIAGVRRLTRPGTPYTANDTTRSPIVQDRLAPCSWLHTAAARSSIRQSRPSPHGHARKEGGTLTSRNHCPVWHRLISRHITASG